MGLLNGKIESLLNKTKLMIIDCIKHSLILERPCKIIFSV